MTTLEQVEKLLANAMDEGLPDEARRSYAMAAIKEAKKGKFQIVVLPEGGHAASPAASPGFHPPPWTGDENPWDGRVDPHGAGAPAPSNWPPPPRSTPAPGQPSGPPPGWRPGRHGQHHRRAAAGAPPDMGRFPIPAMHNGTCHYCGVPWRPGDTVFWKQGLKMTCKGCRNKGPL